METYAKEFDKSNKYWIKVFKIMPENLQIQIMYGSCFVSSGIMLWIMAGLNEKEINKRSNIINYFEEKVYGVDKK